MPKSNTPPEDGTDDAIEEALDAFRELLTPEELAASRDLLLDVLAAHPLGRRLAERVAHALSERLGENVVLPHHGSLSC